MLSSIIRRIRTHFGSLPERPNMFLSHYLLWAMAPGVKFMPGTFVTASPMLVMATSGMGLGYGILEKSTRFHMYRMCFVYLQRFLPTSLLRPLYQMCLVTSFEPIILCELISVHTRVSRFRRDRSIPRPPTGSQLQERGTAGVRSLVPWATPRWGGT